MEQIDQNIMPQNSQQDTPKQHVLGPTNSREQICIEPKPWGFWATTGLAVCIIFGLNLVINFLIGFVMGFICRIHGNPTLGMNFFQSGSFAVISGFIAFPFQIGLSVYFVKLRKQIPVRQYLGLNSVNVKTLCKWSILMLAIAVLPKLIFFPVLKEAMLQGSYALIHLYQTTFSIPLFWVLFCVLAPISEELIFRGFLLKGFMHTRLGFKWANILTSFLWMLLHWYYPISEMVFIFLVGLLFGYGRFKTNSVYTSMVMHFILNIVGIATLSFI